VTTASNFTAINGDIWLQLSHTSSGAAAALDKLSSSTSITLDRILLVVLRSVGRRDTTSAAVTFNTRVMAVLCARSSAIVLPPENITSAYYIK